MIAPHALLLALNDAALRLTDDEATALLDRLLADPERSHYARLLLLTAERMPIAR